MSVSVSELTPLGVFLCISLSSRGVCVSLSVSLPLRVPCVSVSGRLSRPLPDRVSGLCLCLPRSPRVSLSLSPSLCLSVHSVSVSPAISGAFSVPACLVWPEFLPVSLPFSPRRCLPVFRCLWDCLVWTPGHPCLHTLSPLLSVTEPQRGCPRGTAGPNPTFPRGRISLLLVG